MTDPLAAELATLTPEQQRLFLQRLRARRRGSGTGSATPATGESAYPLSAAQERLWLLETLSPGDPAYTVPFAVRITGPLDRQALDAAVRHVLDRHGALRTVIAEDGPDARAVQRVRDGLRAALSWTDLSMVSGPDRDTALARLTAAHSGRTFSLTTGPPLALHAVRLGEHETVLLVAVHHMVFDATSVALFVEDLATGYDAAVTGRHPANEAPTRHFAEYCADERSRPAQHLARQLTHWTGTLRGAPSLSTLPATRPRTGSGGGQVPFRLPADQSAVLQELVRRERTTRYAALLTAFGLALRRANGQDTELVGVPASTRNRPELHRVIGCFYNPQVLRLDMHDDPTVGELLRRAHRAIAAAQANCDIPFGEVVRAVRAARGDRHNPLFQTMLSLLDAPSRDWDGGGVRFTLDPAPAGHTDMDLFLSVAAGADGALSGACRFAGHLDEAAVAAWTADLTGLLAGLADSIDAPVSRFAPVRDTVSAGERMAPAPQRPAYRPPATPAEVLLAGIWATVLGVERVGAHDNFFQLGGDSMQVIQVIAGAAAAGLRLAPADLLRHPTVAGLAAVPPRRAAPVRAASGDVPLTPAQAWFLDEIAPHMAEPAHFNHPYYAALTRPVPATVLAEAVSALVRRHDALRLRLVDGSGGRHQTCLREAPPVPFEDHDLRDADPGEVDRITAGLAGDAQRRLSLTDAPIRAVHFLMPAGQQNRFLLVCHHLVVDGLSRSLIMNDLADALDGAGPAPVPAMTYSAWARMLHDYATAPEVARQLVFWREQVRIGSLPVDMPGAVVRFGTRVGVRRTLAAAHTARLAAAAPAAAVGLGDLLLAAVAVAIAGWQGTDELTVALAAPGRHGPTGHDIDVSRTVGWFQYFYPLRLRPRRGRPLPAVAADLRAQIAAVPSHGLGHGLLARAHPDPAVRRELADIATPQIAFNYLGAIGSWEHQPAARALRPLRSSPGAAQDPAGAWPYLLDVSGELRDGRLQLAVHHSTDIHRTATVQDLADEIVRLLSGDTR